MPQWTLPPIKAPRVIPATRETVSEEKPEEVAPEQTEPQPKPPKGESAVPSPQLQWTLPPLGLPPKAAPASEPETPTEPEPESTQQWTLPPLTTTPQAEPDVRELEMYSPETGEKQPVEIDLSKHTPLVQESIRRLLTKSPIHREGGEPVPEEMIQTPLVEFSEDAEYWGLVRTPRRGLNIHAAREELTNILTSRAYREMGRTPADLTQEEKTDLNERISRQVETEFKRDFELSGIPWIEVDPEETSRKISEGDLSTMADVLTFGAAHWMPHEMYENLVAPAVAMMTPATTARMIDRQGVRQVRQNLVWYYANVAPSTVLGSYWLSEDPNLEYGSPEHLHKIRAGYNIFHDIDRMGELIWEVNPAQKALGETILGKEGMDKAEWWTGMLASAAVVLLEPDLITLTTLGAGKALKVGKVAEKLGFGVAGKMSIGLKATQKAQDTSITNIGGIHRALGEDPHVRQAFDLELAARVGRGEGTFDSESLNQLIDAIPAQMTKAQKAREEADTVAKELGGRAALEKEQAALTEELQLYTHLVDNADLEVLRTQRQLDTQRTLLRPLLIQRGIDPDKYKIKSLKAAGSAARTHAVQWAKAVAKYDEYTLKFLGDRGRDLEGNLSGLRAQARAFNDEFPALAIKDFMRMGADELLDALEAKDVFYAVSRSAEFRRLQDLRKKKVNVQADILLAEAKHIHLSAQKTRAAARAKQAKLVAATGKKGEIPTKLRKLTKKEKKAIAAQEELQLRQAIMPTAREILSEMEGSYRRGLDLARKTPGLKRFVDEPYQRVLAKMLPRGAETKGMRVSPADLRARFTEAYGERAVARFLERPETPLHRFLKGTEVAEESVHLKPEAIAALQRAEQTLAAQSRGAMLVEKGLARAQRLLDESGELSVAITGFSLFSPRTWMPNLRLKLGRIAKTWDPVRSRIGEVAPEMENLYLAGANGFMRGRDETKAIVDYAQKNNLPFHEAAAMYLDDMIALQLPTGVSTLNRQGGGIPKRAFAGLRADVRVKAMATGKPVESVPSFLKALGRMWLPGQTKAKTLVIDSQEALALQKEAARLIYDNPDLTWREFSSRMRVKTQTVLGVDEIAKTDPKTALLGLQAMVGAAIHHDLMVDTYRTMGGVSRETADRLTNMVGGRWQGLAKDADEMETLYETLVAYGMPSFAGRKVKRSFAEIRKMDAGLTEAFEIGEEAVFLPGPILKELDGKIESIIKDVSQYYQREPGNPATWLKNAFLNYMNIWRQDKVTGIGIPRVAHWITTSFSDFAQMAMPLGVRTAAKLSFQNSFANFGTWGRKYQDFLSDMSKRMGEDVPILATPLNAMMNPHLAAVWRGDHRIIRTASGELINTKDVAVWAREDGILETFYRFDQEKVVGLVTRRLEREGFFGTAKAGWSKAREIPAAAMTAVQQRQRMGLYMEYLINRGATRKGAKKAVDDALYDWSHGITEWELYTISKISAFYRYWRLAMGQVARQHVEAFTKPLPMSKVLTGQTGVRRLQQMALFSKEMPAALTQSDNPDGLFDDVEQWNHYAMARAPWHILDTVRPHIPLGAMVDPQGHDNEMAKYLKEQGEFSTTARLYSTLSLSMLGPTDALEMWLTLGAGAYGATQIITQGLDAVPESFYTKTARPFVDMLAPPVKHLVTTGLDATFDTKLAWTGDRRSLRRGEKLLFQALEDQPIAGMFARALGAGDREKTAKGREDIGVQYAIALRSFPVVGSSVVTYLDAIFGHPYDPGSRKALQHFLGRISGIREVPYDPEADTNREAQERGDNVRETLEKATGKSRKERLD